jgi:hypothetical protein
MSPTQPKMCPLLTASTLREEPSKLVGVERPGRQGFDAVPCVGAQCMFFVPIQNEKGAIVGGSCAVTILPQAVSMLNGSIREIGALSSPSQGN